MLAIVLKRSFEYAKEQIEQSCQYAQAYEYRLDTFKNQDISQVKELLELTQRPSIFCLRKEDQGGWFSNNNEKRFELLNQYLALKPTYVDLEYDTPIEYLTYVKETFPEVKIMLSYHDFRSSSDDLKKLVERVFKFEADAYKLVTTARNILDSLKMLQLSVEYQRQGKPFIGVCMGDQGYLTRLLGPIVGHLFDFASSSEEGRSAPGQYTAEELYTVYNYAKLNTKTAVYAMIGHPISQNISHISHNRVFNECGINGLVVKVDLNEDELESFLLETKDLPIQGIGVLTPYKERVFHLLKDLDESAIEIEAANTLLKVNGHWRGFNTDYLGALDAIEEKLKLQDKKVIVIGFGGTGKAVAYTAVKQGAKVVVVNRDREKAARLSQRLGCRTSSLFDVDQVLAEGYDLLVNTTLIGMAPEDRQSPVGLNGIVPGSYVMDLVITPQITKLLEDAQSKGCEVIYGYKMFAYQSAEQLKVWFGLDIKIKKVEEIIEQTYRELIAIP